MRRILISFLSIFPLTVWSASPYDFSFSSEPSAVDFKKIASQVVFPSKFDFFAPAAGKGALGFEIGLGVDTRPVTTTEAKINKQYLKGGKSTPSSVMVPKLKVQKGLPSNIDIALSYGFISGSQFKVLGLGVQWGIVDFAGFPLSLAVRGGYTKTFAPSTIDEYALNGEFLGGLKLAFLEPYVGLGYLIARNALTSPYSVIADVTGSYYLVGLRLSPLPVFGLDIGAQYFDKKLYYLFQVSIGF